MFRRPQKGWIGVDIGTASVKVAQLARNGLDLHVVGRSIVPRSIHDPTLDNADTDALWSAAGEVQAAMSLEAGFSGRQSAAVMPMGLCDVHQIGQIGSESEIDSIVRGAIETITQDCADHLEYDIWPTDGPTTVCERSSWNVLAVARPWADRIYHDVADSGLICRTIDGMPHALARAVTLLAGGRQLPPVGVLDWGFSQATFCVVTEGTPVYVRGLKDCSLERALAAITSELGITFDEAHHLVGKHGLRVATSKTHDEVATLITELLDEPVRQLEQELSRTISHVGFQRRSIAPQRVYLFGGGAQIAGLARHLARRLRLETYVWSLGNEPSEGPRRDCLFATAMALSALAWEDT